MKYHLITYGCQMNTADSEEMARPLDKNGLQPTSNPEQADLILMNTCTVREQAEHRAESNLGRLREWKEKDPNRILVVAGCAATRWGNSIRKRFPFIDLVSPAVQIEKFPEVIAQVLKERWDWKGETGETFGDVKADRCPPAPDPQGRTAVRPYNSIASLPSGELYGDTNTAYVTIMRGCNYSCSYCIVPQVRGREIYRAIPEILQEIQEKARGGKTEVMLLGQTVNSYYYRHEGKVLGFAELLRAVQEIPEVQLIRFMSPHPRHMKESVIEAMRDCKKVARHIHLPVQSGSDALLQDMKRLYTRADYAGIVKSLREEIPGIMVTTDIIVGYPGETEETFGETLGLMKDVRFEGLFAFKYSPRPGTVSADKADDVTQEVKESRLQRVLELNRRLKGKELSPASANTASEN